MINGVRIIAVALGLSFSGGAYYLSDQGVWGESRDLDRSVRDGSGGGGYNLGGRAK